MTRSPVRTGASLAIVIGLATSGCAMGPGTASPDPTAAANSSAPSEPAATPSTECINPPPDLRTLINQTDPVACYGDEPITVDAQVSGVGAIDCAPIEPRWFGCEAWVSLQPLADQTGRTGFVLAATTPLGFVEMFAAIHPETALTAGDIVGRTLRVTGHYDDPAAQTCRQTGPVFDEETPLPPELVIPGCQGMFVMTGFEQL